MPSNLKSQPVAENAGAGAALAEPERRAADHPSRDGCVPSREAAGHTRIEDALRASELHYRRLFESATDGILILDANTGRITDVNPVLERMLGSSRAALLGKMFWDVAPFREIAPSEAVFWRLQAKGYIRYDNLPLDMIGQQRRQVELVGNIYMVGGTRVIQCIIRDVTARQHAEEDARKANDELVALVVALRRRDTEMTLLTRLHDLLQACTTEEQAYQVIALMGGDLFGGQSGSLAIFQARDQHLATVARWGDEPLVQSGFASSDGGAMRRGQPHEVTDPQARLLCHHFVGRPERGYLCVPLTIQGDTLGLLCLVGSAATKDEHLVSRQELAVAVGEALKLALANLRLREKLRDHSIHDSLTGLFNRRYLEESLPRELHRARRGKSSLCVVMLDLDHFKEFNDRLGHAAGDAVLRAFGQLLREELRQSDIACRYGGEEFALILPDSSLEGARDRVEELRRLIREMDLRDGDERLGTVTISAGVAATRADGSTSRDLLRAADAALYTAKRAGRDRVAIAQ